MALTAKPITTISYNTRDFALYKLEQLFKSGKIEDYRIIFHEGEDGDKDHAHVWIQPNRRIDTVQLREEFEEVDPTKDKPLGCLPFRKTKDDHWLMYVLHDPAYLKAHHSDNDGDGKKQYYPEEILTPFPEQLARDLKRAQQLKKTTNQEILECFEKGWNYSETLLYVTNANPTYVSTIMSRYREERMQKQEEEERKKREELEEKHRRSVAHE